MSTKNRIVRDELLSKQKISIHDDAFSFQQSGYLIVIILFLLDT
jgi:hypothetical protein